MRLAIALLIGMSATQLASAQTSDQLRAARRVESGEYFSFELGVGPYLPNASLAGSDTRGSAIERYYPNDNGPMLRIEIDGWAYRIPYVGLLGAGFSWGWAKYTGNACTDENCTTRATGDEGQLRLFPVGLLAVLRVDVLARSLGVPIVLSGKIGPDMIFYRVTGGTGGNGIATGLRWAAQVAVELDFINPRRARSLDEDWGINHSTLFFELLGSTAAAESLELGASLAWTIGLGLHL